MASTFQRVFQALLAAILAFSITPLAYADELSDDEEEVAVEEALADESDEEEEADAEAAEAAESDEAASGGDSDAAVDDEADATSSTDDDAVDDADGADLASGELGSTLSSVVEAEVEKSAATEDAEGPDDPTGTIEDILYVYLDSTIVAVGEEQYVAVGLADEDAVIASAKLSITSLETGESMTVEASSMSGSAVLFTIVFDEGEATNYALSSFSYSLEGSSEIYVIPFEFEDEDDSYAFDVVSEETAEVLESSADSDDVEDVTVVTIDEDGTLAAADSAEEALEIAGATSLLSTLSTDYSSHIVIALDPGHGGSDGGASANGLVESELNWSIMSYCKAELETYDGVEVFVTKTEDETLLSLETRVNRAVAFGADIFISFHINSGGGSGSEIYVPNDSSYLYELHTVGTALAESILDQLEDLGLKNRGVQTRDSTESVYADGSVADYYGVIRYARKAGMLSILIEHAYIDNSSNAAFLSSESNLKKLGVADATGIAEYFGLTKSSSASSDEIEVGYRAYLDVYGWQAWKYDGDTSGSTTLSLQMEAIQLVIEDTDLSGSITYRTHVQDSGWTDWVSDGETSGSTSASKRIEAIQIKLTGELAENYDVYYRVYVEDYGWLDWACNGAKAGSAGMGLAAEAIEVVLVEKGGSAPGDVGMPFMDDDYEGVVAGVSFVELAGDLRYDTMAEVVSEAFGKETSEYAVVATGEDFPDALAAASLAGVLDAPIVLVGTSSASIEIAVEVLDDLDVQEIYVMGGTSAVPSWVVEDLEDGADVTATRVYGDSRQETAVAIANAVLELSDEAPTTAIVAAGANYPDALSISPYAYWSGSPIYLAEIDGTLSSATLAAIEEGGYTNIVIVGGTSVVSSSAKTALEGLGFSVTRLYGDDRYETSTAVAAWCVAQGMSYDGCAVATGENFPDALVGSVLCGRTGSVLLLASDDSVAGAAALTSNASAISKVYFLGGTDAVPRTARDCVVVALNEGLAS